MVFGLECVFLGEIVVESMYYLMNVITVKSTSIRHFEQCNQ